jgi:hypothetical protein
LALRPKFCGQDFLDMQHTSLQMMQLQVECIYFHPEKGSSYQEFAHAHINQRFHIYPVSSAAFYE